ncbi:MAG: gliding motility-associated lipoprotein [Chitinophagia bacterium]|nr:gliding motility-associated lipoprotein [Chitinophagia bacterium]
MRKITLQIVAILTLVFAVSCKNRSTNGQLIGDQTRLNYKAPVPIGMVYVPSGTYKMGASDEDVRGRNDASIHTVQLNGFFMDATEISNQEYRQFTNWVRDSIARNLLQYVKDLPDGSTRLDWNKRINWRSEDVQDQLASMYILPEQSGWGQKLINTAVLIYDLHGFDFGNASRYDQKKGGYSEKAFIYNTPIPCYPDTTCWVKQYDYSYNEPVSRQYFWFQGFNTYPVVGVNYAQCGAFCDWRTHLWKSERDKQRLYTESNFRLPSEEEWEWAARGGRNEAPYPWGGPYIINKKGCYLANFKPQRGNYSADGGLYTVPVDKYAPNDYGLKNMAGNVSEWTSSAYFGGTYQQMADINPSIPYGGRANDSIYLTRKVVRGGSWRDVAYYLQVSTRDYEYANDSKPYIGFRCVYTEILPSLSNRRPTKNR